MGSIIYYKSVPFDQIAEGDSITFRAGENALVTHRVVEKREISQEFVTRGDANNTNDPNPVSYSDVVGKAASISLPYAGYFVSFGKKPAVIGVMAVILVLGMVLDNVKSDGRKAEKG